MNTCACRLFCISFFVLVSCTNNTPCRLSKEYRRFQANTQNRTGDLFRRFLTVWLSVYHTHTVHFSKSPHMPGTFAFLTVALACPRLFDKQALHQSVFDHVNELTKVPASSPRSARQTEPSNNFPAGHRERPVALGTAQFVVSPAPTNNSPLITVWRRRRSPNSTCPTVSREHTASLAMHASSSL